MYPKSPQTWVILEQQQDGITALGPLHNNPSPAPLRFEDDSGLDLEED